MVRFRLERGPVPLHHQVYLDLKAALEAGDWKPAQRLPAERELAEQYGCSLITVRRALDELTREGRLERTRGRGTFVTAPPVVRDIAGQMGFADEVRSFGFKPSTTVVTARDESATSVVAAGLQIPIGSRVWYLERVRGADGVPLLLEQVRLPASLLPDLLDHDFSVDSLWDVLERDYGLPVMRRVETLSAVVPTAREARLLGLRTRRPSIELEGTAYAASGEAVEHARTLVSPERARYFVESSGPRVRGVEPVVASDYRPRQFPASTRAPAIAPSRRSAPGPIPVRGRTST